MWIPFDELITHTNAAHRWMDVDDLPHTVHFDLSETNLSISIVHSQHTANRAHTFSNVQHPYEMLKLPKAMEHLLSH